MMTNQTRIQAMHAEWLRASDAYNLCDEAISRASRDGTALADDAPDALKRLWRQMCQLRKNSVTLPLSLFRYRPMIPRLPTARLFCGSN